MKTERWMFGEYFDSFCWRLRRNYGEFGCQDAAAYEPVWVESNDFGTLQKSDFWTSRTGQNRMKNEFPYRTGWDVFLETLFTDENAEFIEFQSLEDSVNYGPLV
jgi:hypothetical protein